MVSKSAQRRQRLRGCRRQEYGWRAAPQRISCSLLLLQWIIINALTQWWIDLLRIAVILMYNIGM